MHVFPALRGQVNFHSPPSVSRCRQGHSLPVRSFALLLQRAGRECPSRFSHVCFCIPSLNQQIRSLFSYNRTFIGPSTQFVFSHIVHVPRAFFFSACLHCTRCSRKISSGTLHPRMHRVCCNCLRVTMVRATLLALPTLRVSVSTIIHLCFVFDILTKWRRQCLRQ